jgi:hypothetical protein
MDAFCAQIHAKIQIDAPRNDWWYAMGEGTSFHRCPVSFARVVLSCCGTSIVSSHVFVYIACRFRRCIPSRKCEQAPRILARISINCVYETMVRCWNDEWECCSNIECPLDSVECIKLIEKRVWSGVGHLPVSYAGRVVLYPVHS